jgi:hypothetical protein
VATKVYERDEIHQNISYTNVFPPTACTYSGLSEGKSEDALQSPADETISRLTTVYTAAVHSLNFNIIIRLKL